MSPPHITLSGATAREQQLAGCCVCTLLHARWFTGQMKTQLNGSVVPGWRRGGSSEKVPEWLLFPKENRKDRGCQGHSEAKANCRWRRFVRWGLSHHLLFLGLSPPTMSLAVWKVLGVQQRAEYRPSPQGTYSKSCRQRIRRLQLPRHII